MRVIALFVFLLALAGCGALPDATVRVAAASNVRTALEEVIVVFERQAGAEVVVSYGATGKLTTQILNGAPFDVFLAADQEGPAHLAAAGLLADNSPRSYARGRLVFWHPGGDATGSLAARLEDPGIRHVALANPLLAPYGRAAEQTLERLGVAEAVSGKRVQGENIGQAFALVATGNAQAGFIAASQVAGTDGDWWAVDPSLHRPIIQDAARIAGRGGPQADAFFNFLFSDAAREILARHGYDAP